MIKTWVGKTIAVSLAVAIGGFVLITILCVAHAVLTLPRVATRSVEPEAK